MRTLLPLLFVCAPLIAQTPPPAPTPAPVPKQAVEVGKPAPSFRLNDQTGAATKVGGASKNWTVVAFYPKASTGG